MNIIADTNLLVRFFIQDDETQFSKVSELFEKSSTIIIPTNALCELVWVLSYSYRLQKQDIAEIIRMLLNTDNVLIKDAEVEFGLKMLEQNGDFADGINAISGIQMTMGQEVAFASFDKKAVKILRNLGINVVEL